MNAGPGSDDRPTGRLVVCPVLVGRDAELNHVLRRWNTARVGSGHFLLLSGEAGIGKTRLIAEFAEASHAPRRLTATTFARDAESAGTVVLAVSDALLHATWPGAHADAQRLRDRLLSTAGSDQAEKTVEVRAGMSRGADQQVAGDAARSRRLLSGDIAGLILTVLTERPTLLIIEDLHWADEFSLEALERLAISLPETSSMIIASFRNDELYPRSPLRAWRSRLLSRRLVEEVRLHRLAAETTAAMIEAIMQNMPPAAYSASVHDRSDGIPLHVEELIAAGSRMTVPDTLADAVLARIAALSADAQRTVTAAAVIGRTFDVDVLAAVDGTAAEGLDRALTELVSSHVVVAGSDGMTFDFRHALIRDAIYENIPPLRRRDLHSAAAEAAIAAGVPDAAISDHFERARRAPEAHAYALSAADDASRLSAHREAAELFRRAQRTTPNATASAVTATLRVRLAAELAASDQNEAAAAELQQAIALRRRLGDELGAVDLVPRLMAARHLLGDDLTARTALADDALRRLDAAPAAADAGVRSRLLAALAAAYMLDRRLDESLEYGRQAADLAAGPGAAAELTDLDLTMGSVMVFAGDSDGWRLLEHAVQTSEQAALEALAARAYRMIGSCASVLVEYDRAERFITRGLAYTARTERFNDHHYLRAHWGHTLWATGDISAAESAARQALADGGDGITTRITALIVLGYCALSTGDLTAAQLRLDEARALGEQMNELQRLSPALWGLAELAAARDDTSACIQLCERGRAASAEVDDAAYLFPFVVTGTRALLKQGDIAGARAWVETTSALLRRRSITATLPALDHAAGLILLAEGRLVDARHQLERALAAWRASRRVWEAHFAAADVAAVAAAAAAAAVTAPRSALVSDREREVAELVARGSTNREIASALSISAKTVSTHVEHILSKLGAGRRAEIAAWFVRDGAAPTAPTGPTAPTAPTGSQRTNQALHPTEGR